jgi:MFS family permease
VLLTQGLGAGIGSGLTYVPSVAILSQYFKKKRALTMMIVSAGASVGSIIHPIMLNNTLESHLGFGNAVRASAGLVAGLLIIACALLRTRIPVEKRPSPGLMILKSAARDGAYVAATVG